MMSATERSDIVVMLSPQQHSEALSDYISKHGLVPAGSYKTIVEVAISDGRINHVRLTYTKE